MKAHKIALYVGLGYDGEGVPLMPHIEGAGLEAIRMRLAQMAGGYSEQGMSGGWIDPDTGKRTDEETAYFEAVITRPLSDDEAEGIAWELAGFAAEQLKQKSVLYVITPVIAGFAGPQREN